MDEMLISIVIPVYNVEKQLRECVNSVLKQTYKKIEIILVDDGSPDNCPLICDEYEKTDARVKAIHQKNGGLSNARNRGMKEAQGEYLLFLDGDDYYCEENAIEKLVDRIKITKADVLNFSYVKYYEDTNQKIEYFMDIENMPTEFDEKKQQLEYMEKFNLYIASACNKMIRRNLLSKEMMFEEGVYSEDIYWCAKLLLKAGSVDFVCENFYYYRQRRDSIRHTIDDKKCEDLCNNIIKCFELRENDVDSKQFMNKYLAFQYGTFFLVQAQATNKQKECINKLKNYKWILKFHGNNQKLLCLYIGCKIVGYRAMCGLIRNLYYKK